MAAVASTGATNTEALIDGDWVVEGIAASFEDSGAVEKRAASPLRVEAALEHDVILDETSKIAAVLSVVAPAVDESARAALRLVAVLDKSGSMSGEKLRLVVQTMRFMLRHLSDRDALGIVEYDTLVKVLAPLTRCDVEGRQRLDAALGRLQAGSQTNLSGGLLKGLDLHGSESSIDGAAASPPLQAVAFGNTYRRLLDEDVRLLEEEAHERESFGIEGLQRIHEWTMCFRFENLDDARLVKKVVYNLHETFATPVVEVADAPFFYLTRNGWGTFTVKADVHLHDGRILTLEHDLDFSRPEAFATKFMPLHAGTGQTCFNLNPLQAALESCSKQSATAVNEEDGVVRSTFLFTDGKANVGITNIEDLCAAANVKLVELGKQRSTLSTFGFGKDHSAELLEKLAEVGGGVYSYVEDEDQIGQAFGEALGGLLSTTHQNLSMSLHLRPGVRLARACTDYAVVDTGRGLVNIELGDVFAEERRDILVELALSHETKGASALETADAGLSSQMVLATLDAQGFSVMAKYTEKTAAVDLKVSLQSRGSADTSRGANPTVKRHRNRHVATEALKAARAMASRGDLGAARRALTAAVVSLGNSALTRQGDTASLGLLADLNECLKDLRREQDYYEYGSKKMACYQQSHTKQRSMNLESTESYSNSSMRHMKSAFKGYVS